MITDFCVACHARADLHQHHLLPKIYGGTDDVSNLITLCIKCHGIIHDRNIFSVPSMTRAALQKKKIAGQKYAPVPFGFKEVGGRLVEAPVETAIVADILSMRRRGITLSSIAGELNSRGISGKNGGKWYASTVRYLIQRQAA